MGFFTIFSATLLGNLFYEKITSRNIDKKISEVIKKRWLE